MNRSGATHRRPTRPGFTLVELLTVVVIIGILVSLITAAAWRARVTARTAAIITEIGDLGMALEAYRTEVGEYPPCNFADHDRVLGHLRKRFPRYPLTGTTAQQWSKFTSDATAVQLNVNSLDPASALVFWLGGVGREKRNASNQWVFDAHPSGFSADPENPFTRRGSRTKMFLEFDVVRLQSGPGGTWRYVPRYTQVSSGAPYVYFRSGINGYGGLSCSPGGNAGVAVPYWNGDKTAWREANKFQIIAAGADGRFGAGTGDRCSQSGVGINAPYYDYDNITNFSKGVLQDEM